MQKKSEQFTTHEHIREPSLTKVIVPQFRMGTPEWIEHVFSTPPVRNLKGHSKHTQYHRLLSGMSNERLGVQGGNECDTLRALEYLGQIGMLTRFKPQPFKTAIVEFGFEIVPDFLIEVSRTKDLIVIETKDEKFLTRAKHRRIEEVRAKFKEFGIKYLVWTGRRPLTRSVCYHLICMRLANNERMIGGLKGSDVESAVAWIKATPQPTYEQFFRADFDSDCLFAAAWRGDAYFPLTRSLERSTPLGMRPFEDFNALFLGCENRIDEWWHELEDF